MTQKLSLRWYLQLEWLVSWGWVGAIAAAVSQTFAFTTPILAQSNIVPDNTQGKESSIVTPNAQGLPREEITGGAVRGANLFHSFQEFNVDAGREAYFSPNASIQNILTRVTGTNASQIFGTLGTIGNANLFLINPNGIIFGPNAALNVGGSFVGTTANAVQFGNLGNFSASTPDAPSPLLTINPSALLFNQLSKASITNKSTADAGLNPVGDEVTGLRVPHGRSLLLVGGNVNLDGGNLRAYEGRIELAGLATPGSIGLNVAGNNLKLSVPSGVPRADVSLTNGAEVNVRGANSGSIAVHARNLNMAGESKLRAGIESGNGSPDSQAGDIEINATGSTTLSDSSLIANVVQPEATGTGGNINITTQSLTLSNNAILNTNTFGQGDAGRVFVQASGAVYFDNSNIYNNLGRSAVGNTGGILITAESLSLTNGAQVQSSILGANASEPGGRGNTVGVNISVSDRITLAGVNQNGTSSGIFTDIEAGAVGNGGDINISAKSLSLTDGAVLDARTAGFGNGGNMVINARSRVDFDGKGNTFSVANTTVQPGAVGNAGDIRLTTATLSLTNGAFLTSSTLGNGDAGNITINARNTISFDSGSAYSNVFSSGVGKGGDIRVTTGTLSLTNGAQLSTNVSGQGDAGNITIDARDTINLDGTVGYATSGVQSSLLIGSEGKAGNIQMTTGSLTVQNGARISTSSDGIGVAGNITLNARDTITFEDSSASTKIGSYGVGSGGDIRVNARALFLKNGGQLDAVSFGSGNAGSITIDASDIVAFDGVDSNGLESSAKTFAGENGSNGGDIRITTGILSLTNGGQLSSFAHGNAGNITIDARNTVSFDGVGNRLSSGAVSVLLAGKGKGGDIQITTGSLSITNGARLLSNTFGQGNAGNITINARDAITLNGTGSNGRLSGLFSAVGSTGVGKGGDIRVKSGTLSLSNFAQINASTSGRADAGNISVKVDDAVTLTNSSQITTTVASGGLGKAGDIDILARSLSVADGSQIQSALFRPIGILPAAQGRGGNIRVTTTDSITVSGISSTGFSSA
ncbi:filamentous hemagglutinin N-terminal domain-containing protein, partial [Iningainema tapete]